MTDNYLSADTALALGVTALTCAQSTCPGYGTPHYVTNGNPEFHRAYEAAGDGWAVEVDMWPGAGRDKITADDEWLIFIQTRGFTGPVNPENAMHLALAITAAALEARTRNATKRGE